MGIWCSQNVLDMFPCHVYMLSTYGTYLPTMKVVDRLRRCLVVSLTRVNMYEAPWNCLVICHASPTLQPHDPNKANVNPPSFKSTNSPSNLGEEPLRIRANAPLPRFIEYQETQTKGCWEEPVLNRDLPRANGILKARNITDCNN